MDEPLNKPPVTGAQPPDISSTVEVSPPAQNEAAYFNVMPKSAPAGGIVEPTVIEEAAAEEPKGPTFFQKFKLYIIIGALVLIAGPIIYIVATKLSTSSYQPEDLISKNAAVHQPPAQGQQSTSTPDASFATPKDWRDKYFSNCSDPKTCGDNADPDRDGLNNLQENQLGTDPNNPDSDQDGLSDGDEARVFLSDPSNAHSSGDKKYNDADYFKGGFDLNTGSKMSATANASLSARMQQYGLHQPTVTTMGNLLNTLYNFSPPDSLTPQLPAVTTTPSATANASSTLDQSIGAKTARDTARAGAIKNIEVALVAFYKDNQSYPSGGDFGAMFLQIKPYLKVATNPQDPVNVDPYVYSYLATSDNMDFTLSFFSEAYGQLIKKHAADANADAAAESAAIYDNQRETDLDSLRTALLLYSSSNAAGSQVYVFPTKDKLRTSLVPTYISAIPKDPTTGQDYDYEPNATFDGFTLKAVLQNPPAGNTGYICNQIDDCHYY